MPKCVVLIGLILLVVLGAEVLGAEVARVAIPSNIQPGLLAEDIEALMFASPTFRAQCARIGAARALRVDVELVQTLGARRAETTITHYGAGAIRAEVRITFGHEYRELIGHEFEHVIEQLDGVDLRTEAEHGRAWMVADRTFETRRASDAGRRVRLESELSGAHGPLAVHDLR